MIQSSVFVATYDHDCYIAKSNDYPDIVGYGDTPRAAIERAVELAEDYDRRMDENRAMPSK